MSPSVQLLVGILTLAGVISGAMITGRYALRKSTLEAKASPYEALSDRVSALEAKLSAVEAQQERDRAYIRAAVPWIARVSELYQIPAPAPPEWWTEH